MTRAIAGEQQAIIDIATAMNRGQQVVPLSSIPTNMAAVFPEGANVRYLAVVELRDSVTGARKETRLEWHEDVPLLTDDVRDAARQAALQGLGEDTITAGGGPDAVWGVSDVRIISVSRRG